MAFNQHLQALVVVFVIILLAFYVMIFHICPGKQTNDVYNSPKLRLIPTDPPASNGPCSCPKGSLVFKDHIPQDQYEKLVQRRAKELEQHEARTTSVLSKKLYAAPNSPLKYPIQGFTVKPLTPSAIPGLELHAGERSNYKVTITVHKGVLNTEVPPEGVITEGEDGDLLFIESYSLVMINYILAQVTYTSKVYHIHTGDLAIFKFENHEAVFPITIKQPQMPVLYDMGTDISSHVTITTKTFLRYSNLDVLIKSIRSFYSKIPIIIADDSFDPEKITGENIQHYIMPPAQGWFAGRNLAISQVTTKYLLWVDDDFVFTEKTKIEELVNIMEGVPELDVLGGSVEGKQFYFTLVYDEGQEMDGGCLLRKSNRRFLQLPGYPHCSLTSGVVNFFLARTDAVQRVGFDPKLQRVAHSEFFMDGLGSLMVASCNHVAIGHQPRSSNKDNARYQHYRKPGKEDERFKEKLHFFKNHLKCVLFG
ncbi:beta-1,4 N-acetylgalactosaminyltransferase 2-like [Notolabrus celidotus]|uniref:beta-1,4 N-acetylgalactosaminyltransferase 2-like n=1 Tax=Notolabrus celidotus TaxID=1203425 RepID=UPI0014905038|nr:beta-1,4 N-acetylgalactosaminyltransferase 2-like [Notolabrus celidotus]